MNPRRNFSAPRRYALKAIALERIEQQLANAASAKCFCHTDVAATHFVRANRDIPLCAACAEEARQTKYADKIYKMLKAKGY